MIKQRRAEKQLTKFQKQSKTQATTELNAETFAENIPEKKYSEEEQVDEEKSGKGGQKRKRKTADQLAQLQKELRKGNIMWSGERIKDISKQTGMNETQVYKWWWDQTHKKIKSRQNAQKSKARLVTDLYQEEVEEKFAASLATADNTQLIIKEAKDGQKEKESDAGSSDDLNFMPAIDEFGGYSSRLRMHNDNTGDISSNGVVEESKASAKPTQTKNDLILTVENAPKGHQLSLHELLGIDIE